LIAAGTHNGILCFFDVQSGGFLDEFVVHGAQPTTLRFSADGTQLYTASTDGSVGNWQVS